ncbi:MAG: tetratricopeptide repeat protein [Candidatus Neomarinimicrobiota bacterium]
MRKISKPRLPGRVESLIAVVVFAMLVSNCALPLITGLKKSKPAEPPPPTAMELYARGRATNDSRQQVNYLTQALNLQPDLTVAYLERGKAFFNLERYDSAIVDFNHVQELNPDVQEVWTYRAQCYGKLGKYKEAAANYDRAIALNPLYELYYLRANLHKSNRRFDLAIKDYTAALKTKPQKADLYANRAFCYQKLKKSLRALEDYQQAIKLKPNDAELYYNIGTIYWTLGRWQLVVQNWEKCQQLNPQHLGVRQYLSTAKKKAQGN